MDGIPSVDRVYEEMRDVMTKGKLSLSALRAAKGRARKLTMVTAYDFPSAVLVDESPIEMLLVGDSLGNNVLGYAGTAPVTMDEMLHHLRAVVRGAPHTLIVGDLPFGSYNVSPEQAIAHATQFIKAGAECVKLEGGVAFATIVRSLVVAGIPVMGHTGLMPQTVHPSAWTVQGRDPASAKAIIDDALALEAAGVSAVVLEAVPAQLAAHITATVSVPTIGIAAGPECDGQVLVWNDVLGLGKQRARHVKRYAALNETIAGALAQYCLDVEKGEFPGRGHSYTMTPDELAAVLGSIATDGDASS